MKKWIHLVEKAASSQTKIDRSAFLYLSPATKDHTFAQCGSCCFFMPKKQQCSIFSDDIKVIAKASCGLYIHGKPNDQQPVTAQVTSKEAGYVETSVRCENCHWVREKTCNLYATLNQSLPDIFDLNTDIEDQACCNGFQPYKKP